MTGDTPSFLLLGAPLFFDERQTAADSLSSLFNRRQLIGLCERVQEESHDDQSANKAGHGENVGGLIG